MTDIKYDFGRLLLCGYVI